MIIIKLFIYFLNSYIIILVFMLICSFIKSLVSITSTISIFSSFNSINISHIQNHHSSNSYHSSSFIKILYANCNLFIKLSYYLKILFNLYSKPPNYFFISFFYAITKNYMYRYYAKICISCFKTK